MQAFIQKVANATFPAEELWSRDSHFMAIKKEPEGVVLITHGIYRSDYDVSFTTKSYQPSDGPESFVDDYIALYPDYQCFAMLM
jgi:hypothetical protein